MNSVITFIRENISKTYNLLKNRIKNTKNKATLLRTNNYYIAINFFNQGEITECIRRLKIALKLWPDDDDFKYLLALSYIIYRDCEKVLLVLNNISPDYKQDIIKKLILLAKMNKSKKIIDFYIKTGFNIVLIENEIKNMVI